MSAEETSLLRALKIIQEILEICASKGECFRTLMKKDLSGESDDAMEKKHTLQSTIADFYSNTHEL